MSCQIYSKQSDENRDFRIGALLRRMEYVVKDAMYTNKTIDVSTTQHVIFKSDEEEVLGEEGSTT